MSTVKQFIPLIRLETLLLPILLLPLLTTLLSPVAAVVVWVGTILLMVVVEEQVDLELELDIR